MKAPAQTLSKARFAVELYETEEAAIAAGKAAAETRWFNTMRKDWVSGGRNQSWDRIVGGVHFYAVVRGYRARRAKISQ